MIKDVSWYYENQDTYDKIISNIVFLFVSIYFYNKNNLLSLGFLILFFCSTLFHIKSNKTTLLIDRLSMIFIFSIFFNKIYPISIFNYFLVGFISITIWYYTNELLFYILFQCLGIYLLLNSSIKNKEIISILFVVITLSQLIDKGKYHSLKHILLAMLSIYFFFRTN